MFPVLSMKYEFFCKLRKLEWRVLGKGYLEVPRNSQGKVR
jgi:hypothetical protein